MFMECCVSERFRIILKVCFDWEKPGLQYCAPKLRTGNNLTCYFEVSDQEKDYYCCQEIFHRNDWNPSRNGSHELKGKRGTSNQYYFDPIWEFALQIKDCEAKIRFVIILNHFFSNEMTGNKWFLVGKHKKLKGHQTD